MATTQARDPFEPVTLRSSALVTANIAAMLGIDVWIWFRVVDPGVRTALHLVILCAATAAFVAGNAHRLRDIRARYGSQLRAGNARRREDIAGLPRPAAIHRRLRAGLAFAVLFWLATGVALFIWPVTTTDTAVTVAFILGLGHSGITYVTGLFSRPLR